MMAMMNVHPRQIAKVSYTISMHTTVIDLFLMGVPHFPHLRGSLHQKMFAGLREFSSEEISTTTENFSVVVGKGGFGKVYKGNYHHSNVAVKVLNVVNIASTTKVLHCIIVSSRRLLALLLM